MNGHIKELVGELMTTIKNSYIGITHPLTTDKRLSDEDRSVVLIAWKTSNCPQGIHMFDEVWSATDHYLCCDACGIEVHISKIVIPDGKDEEVE